MIKVSLVQALRFLISVSLHPHLFTFISVLRIFVDTTLE
jgi:hypothetical protein